MSWPEIEVPATITADFVKRQLSTGYETGRIVSTADDVIGHWEFTLTWPDMDEDDLALLAAAVEADMGSEFSWKHYYRNTWYTVKYAEDGFKSKMTEDYVVGHNSVTVNLIEIPLNTATTTTTTTTTSTTTTTTA